MGFELRICNRQGDVLARANGRDEAVLVYQEAYQPGDWLDICADAPGGVMLSLDATLGPALVYLTEPRYRFAVPVDDERRGYCDLAFAGHVQRLSLRRARAGEMRARRNLAFNPFDRAGQKSIFPHVEANAGTRGEAAFAVRNVIDGECATQGHGKWPFTSWGIDRNPDAALTLAFGRPVNIDELVLYLRADFPHDAWWRQASVTLSNGETREVHLSKSGCAQSFPLVAPGIEWLKLHRLIKADDPSPFPALTQIEVWGEDRSAG